MIYGIGEWGRSGFSWGLSKDCQRKTAIGGSEWYSRKPVQRQGWGGHGHKSVEIGSEKEWWVSSVRWLNGGGTEQCAEKGQMLRREHQAAERDREAVPKGHCELRLTITFVARAALQPLPSATYEMPVSSITSPLSSTPLECPFRDPCCAPQSS